MDDTPHGECVRCGNAIQEGDVVVPLQISQAVVKRSKRFAAPDAKVPEDRPSGKMYIHHQCIEEVFDDE